MTYEEFKRELYRNILMHDAAKGKVVKLLDRRMSVADAESIRLIKRINFDCYGQKSIAVKEDMLGISWGNTGMVNIKYFRLKEMYGRFLKEGWKGVLPEIVIRLQSAGEDLEGMFTDIRSYDKSRGSHILRPLNYTNNAGDLDNCLYWKFGDIMLVLYALVYDGSEELMTMKISRDITDNWGISDDVILSEALLNTRLKMPPRLFHGGDLRYRYKSMDGIFMPDDGEININIIPTDRDERVVGYRLTTARWLNGAIAVFYPYVKERIAEMMKGDYYLGFESIHEAVIYPLGSNIANNLRNKIRYTNIMSDKRRMLSNRIFRYNYARRELIEI